MPNLKTCAGHGPGMTLWPPDGVAPQADPHLKRTDAHVPCTPAHLDQGAQPAPPSSRAWPPGQSGPAAAQDPASASRGASGKASWRDDQAQQPGGLRARDRGPAGPMGLPRLTSGAPQIPGQRKFRKHWHENGTVKTWFNQPARKARRSLGGSPALGPTPAGQPPRSLICAPPCSAHRQGCKELPPAHRRPAAPRGAQPDGQVQQEEAPGARLHP